MERLSTLFIFLLSIGVTIAFNHTLSSKVMIWNHHIKVFKCPIHTIEEIKDAIDPSILIFKSKQATKSFQNTPVIVANQTDYLAHHVKAFTIFDQYTFAYASMASMHVLFDRVHIINQPGYFEQKNNPNKEYIPEDELIDYLNRTKTVHDNVFNLKNIPVYKCAGKNGSIYLLVKSTNVTTHLKVNDVIYSEKSDGFLETIQNVDQIKVESKEYRLMIETKLTDCSISQETLESRIKNLHLINLDRNDLNCKGGYNANLSLYVTKNHTYITKLFRENSLIDSVIIGRKSNTFAYRIISVNKIGKHILFETSESLFPPVKRFKRGWFRKIWRAVKNVVAKVVKVVVAVVQFIANLSTTFNWNFKKGYTYKKVKSFDFAPVAGVRIGGASISFTFNPSVTVTASIRAGFSGVKVMKAGITLDINTNLNAKLNLNTITIDYDWPENEIIALQEIARFVVPAGPILLPGTINVGLYSQHGLKIVTTRGINFNAEANFNLNLHLPFVHHSDGPSELPNGKFFNTNSFFHVNVDFSELNNQPTFILRERLIPKISAKWPDLGEDLINKLKSFIPKFLLWLFKLIKDSLNLLQISVTGSLPLIHTKELSLCSNKCSNKEAVLITNNFGLDAFNLNFKAPFINKNWKIPSSGQPIAMFDAFHICLPINLRICPLNFLKLCSRTSPCTYPQVCKTSGNNAGTCVACNANSDCIANVQPICSSNNSCISCSNNQACLAKNLSTSYCIGTGECIVCLSDLDCSNQTTNKFCLNYACKACRNNSDCAGTKPVCSASGCVPCTSSEQCSAISNTNPICITATGIAKGSCTRCNHTDDCIKLNNSKCNITSGACQECFTFSDCPATTVCNNGKCQGYQLVDICENTDGNLSCSTGVIKIISANYGRTSTSICTVEKSALRLASIFSNTNCFSNQTAFMQNSCGGNSSVLNIHPSQTTFGIQDPCPGTYKYLETKFYCL